ncbi:TCP-1/cpn60 chaperonin family protein [Methanolapillus millepedarum]|uniref:60 kDa chaperonin n=1 Tax=Methanolapillus millepedarum TaxID=3028296 RepID=A0AA96V4I2_9EURY|nr:60 kDa chaperonin [Methanosarcinaceae archaeon Ac7]
MSTSLPSGFAGQNSGFSKASPSPIPDELIRVLRERSVTEAVGEDQLMFHIETLVSDILKMVASSYGPLGMNKLIVNPVGDVYLTSDGKNIIKEIDLLHPVAVSLKRLGQSMDKSCGDGTKYALILACGLLLNAVSLLRKKVHPMTIIDGYELAMGKAYEMLEFVSEDADDDMIFSAVKAAAFSKGIEEGQATALAKAMIQTVAEVDKYYPDSFLDLEDNVKILKKTGSPDIFSFQGVILDETPAREDMPKHILSPRILLLRSDLKVKSGYLNPEHFVRMDNPMTAFEFKKAKNDVAETFAEKVLQSGANLVFCEGEVDSVIEEAFSRHHILLFKRLKEVDLDYIFRASGAQFSTIADDLTPEVLGYADEIVVKKTRYETFAYLAVSGPVTSVLIHEPAKYGLGKIEEAADDALNTAALLLKNPSVVTGGGGTEYFLTRSLRIFANTLDGKHQLAVLEFAKAMEAVPKFLAKNIGMDPVDSMIQLSAMQEEGIDARVDASGKVIANSPTVFDCAMVKKYGLVAAVECVSNVLRVDEILLKK